MATEVDKLIVALEARLDGYNRNLSQAQALTNTRLRAIEQRFDQMATRLRSSASTAALGIRGMLGGVGAYLGVAQIREYADSWTSVTRALEASEQVFGMRLRSASELNKLANEARIDNDSLSKLYIRTAAATRELGASEEDVAKATTTVAKALKLGSAAASEQTSVMLQLSQALQKGKLDGDEFRSVMENAGVIQELLADKLKVSKGEIVRMAAEGKLSVDALFSALVEGADKVDRIFRRMPATIGEGFLVLNNQIEEYIGNLDKTYGSTEAMVAALKALADNVEPIADSVLVLGGALLAAFSPKIIAGILAMTVGIASAAGPLGIVVGGLAGASVYAERFGDTMNFNVGLMRQAIDGGADFEAAWNQAFSNADQSGVTLQDTFRALASILIEDLGKAFADLNAYVSGAMEGTLGDVLGWIKDVLNKMIGAAVFAKDAIAIAFTGIPGVIGEKVVDTINRILSGLQSLIDGATDGLNNLIAGINRIPGVDVGFLTAPDLGQIESKYAGAGEAAGEAFTKAMGQVSRDWLGEAGTAIADHFGAKWMVVLDRIDKKARENALARQWQAGTSIDRDIPSKPAIKSPDVDKAAERARKNFEKDLLRAEQRITMAKLEADAIGRSAEEVEYMRTRQELLNEARKAGVELTDADMIKIEALSQATARAVTEAESLRRAYEDVSDESKEMLSQFIKDMKDGVSASEALGSALNRIADKLIDMAVNDLVEVALGGLTGKGGNPAQAGLAGGLMSLFGGFASGGKVTGPGTGTSDSIPARLSNGEYVVNAEATRRYQPLLEAINSGRVPAFAAGGPVNIPNVSVPTAVTASGGVSVNFAPVFNMQNATEGAVNKTQNEMLPKLREMVRAELVNTFNRSNRFARSGI